MFKNLSVLFIIFTGKLFILACQDQQPLVKSVYHYQVPNYDSVTLIQLTDTLHFPLRDDVFTDIRSFNLFHQNNTPCIAFYDERSQTVNVYKLKSQRRHYRLKLKTIFKKETLYKTSVYVRNFDSIFIVNNENIFLYDTAGKQKAKIDLIESSRIARVVLDNNNPIIIKGTKVFAIVGSRPDQKSIDELREWRVLYEFDFEKEKARLHYNLPELYHKNLYGRHFLDYNYCYNDRGHFVFSFPADTTLYETDLQGYHVVHFARSQFQKEAISPVSKEALENDEARKEYSLRYSYGSVFFDPYRKYYLRFVKHKVTETAYAARSPRKETVLIFNEHLSIIGECDWVTGVDFNSLFFTHDGQLYGRTNFRDENALHFVKLTFHSKDTLSTQLTKK